MEKVTVLTIIFTPSPKEKHSNIYVYNKEHFIVQITENSEIEQLKTKYIVEDEFIWHFLNAGKLQEFLDKELAEYYGKMNIGTLSGYIVKSLNYKHTGISIRHFEKGMIYIGKDSSTYICLDGRTIYDSKWLQTDDLKKYHTNSYNLGSFSVPSGTEFDVIDWIDLKTELVNITEMAELQDYIIEKNKLTFK